MDQPTTQGPPPGGIDPKLAQCIHKAQAEVRAALKTSTNTFHNYRYASADEVVTVARDALEAAGLAWLVIEERIELLPAGSADWAGGAVALLHATYAMVCADNGAAHRFPTTFPIVPTPGKSSGWSRELDKSTAAARTEANGYALRDALLIPREDAPDVAGRRSATDRREEGNGGNRRAPEFTPFSVSGAVEDIRKAPDLSRAASVVASARTNALHLPAEDAARLQAAFTARAVEVIDGYAQGVQVQKASALLQRYRPQDEDQAARIDAALLRAKARTGQAS
jgi:hypothetical protein